MEQRDIKEKIEKLRLDRDKQQEKVDKLNENIDSLRKKLMKENDKLGQLNDKMDQQEFYLLKSKLSQYGISGEDGIEDLLLIYEQYGKNQDDESISNENRSE